MADLVPQNQGAPVTTRDALDRMSPLLQSARAARWRRQIFAITWIAYAGFYFVRQAFSVAKLGILDDPAVNTVLTERALGVIDAVYLAAYAAGQFLWGMWADRFGPRVVVIGGMIGAVAAACIMGVSSALLVFGGAMVLQGLSQSAGWAPLCKNMGNFFTVAERGRILGLWSTNYAFGGLAAPPFLGWVAYSVFDSWHAAFLAGAATLAAVLLLFVLFQRNAPQDVGLVEPTEETDPESGTTPESIPIEPSLTGLALYRETLRDRMVLTLGLSYFLLKPARYAILLWGPVIVSRRLPEIDKVGATLIPVAFGAAGILAPILVGWVSDRLFQSRRAPACVIALGVLTAALALFMPLTAAGSAEVMIAVLAVIGLSVYAADAMISCVAAVDFGSAKGAGTAAGLVNGCGSIGAILGGLLPGFLSGGVLFTGFAGAALLAGLLMLPHWNRLPRTA
ncbi:MFS transporter [Streptomyces sp. NBC_00841]|uniref:MFS transporter n=1 Tax=unclassified Streptomyces TaxID=2593676 RepID=UPI002251FB7D|nr:MULTISPECIES: MFS transporter [unclassified Streptomyces]MCX4531565.1 MFS transporter [Streptomyces sp. NBC_01669]WSA02864.1 MFS transporter [Streptomyces sp. NBC_00841]